MVTQATVLSGVARNLFGGGLRQQLPLLPIHLPPLCLSPYIYITERERQREGGCRPRKDKLLALLGQECFNNEDAHLCVAETTLFLTSHKSFSLLKHAATAHQIML